MDSDPLASQAAFSLMKRRCAGPRLGTGSSRERASPSPKPESAAQDLHSMCDRAHWQIHGGPWAASGVGFMHTQPPRHHGKRALRDAAAAASEKKGTTPMTSTSRKNLERTIHALEPSGNRRQGRHGGGQPSHPWTMSIMAIANIEPGRLSPVGWEATSAEGILSRMVGLKLARVGCHWTHPSVATTALLSSASGVCKGDGSISPKPHAGESRPLPNLVGVYSPLWVLTPAFCW